MLGVLNSQPPTRVIDGNFARFAQNMSIGNMTFSQWLVEKQSLFLMLNQNSTTLNFGYKKYF